MVIEAENKGISNNPEAAGQQYCFGCGEALAPGALIIQEGNAVCPACRQNKVRETLLYIKELLSDNCGAGKKTA